MTEDELLDRIRARVAVSGAWDGPALVATPAEIAEAEHAIGFPIPPLLRRIYLEIANGGFGPYDSVIGVGEGAWTSDVGDIAVLYRGFGTRPEGHPPGIVPVYDVGCANWWLIDFRDPAGPMWGWDPDGCCHDHALAPQGVTLGTWLAETLDGSDARRIEQPWVCRPVPVWPPERPPRKTPPADPAPAGPPMIADPMVKRSVLRVPPAAAPRRPSPARDPRPRWTLRSPHAASRPDEP